MLSKRRSQQRVGPPPLVRGWRNHVDNGTQPARRAGPSAASWCSTTWLPWETARCDMLPKLSLRATKQAYMFTLGVASERRYRPCRGYIRLPAVVISAHSSPLGWLDLFAEDGYKLGSRARWFFGLTTGEGEGQGRGG